MLVDAVTWMWKRAGGVTPRTRSAAVCTCAGTGGSADRRTRTVKSLRTCAIRLRPISGVGKECSASRVLSMALAARITAQPRRDAAGTSAGRDVHLDRVHRAAGRVQLDDVRQRHQEQPAVRVVPAETRDVVADRLDQAAAGCCTCRS